ncbi:hypothetical protein VTL71DRAFT_16095 [Oculimacula yallundae]|uniref:Uncharacterized protein n=1 Tax=Oculimacula yallundae TaxID=86028 RepID=A0ABR4CEQ2_9HELO
MIVGVENQSCSCKDWIFGHLAIRNIFKIPPSSRHKPQIIISMFSRAFHVLKCIAKLSMLLIVEDHIGHLIIRNGMSEKIIHRILDAS